MPIKKQKPKRDHWTCPLCGETYYAVIKYAVHMRVAHRPHRCPRCRRMFETEEKLQAHFLEHKRRPWLPS